MKSFLVAISLLLVPLGLSAQCASDIDRIMLRANESLAAEDYRLAIERLLFARDECPDRKDAINALIKQTFAQIDREKREADSALAVAERVLDKLYFYEDKFGLTLKNVGSEFQPKYRYGYINRQGEEVIPFEYEEALPYSERDGFARIRQEGKNYLLDTLGRSYLLATSFAEVSSQTQALDLHESRPTTLPAEIGSLPNLAVLLVYGGAYEDRGQLEQLPAELFNLSQLKVLNLAYNQFREVPAQINLLSQLEVLDLHYNLIGDLSASIGQLRQLRSLELSLNEIGELPPEIGNLQQLQSLNLGWNQLSALPMQIGQLSQLRELHVFENQLIQLPEEIGQLSRLQILNLYDNQLTDLPDQIGDLNQLTSLILHENRLEALPPTIGNLHQLRIAELHRNKLSSLPSEIGNLRSLEELDLSKNRLLALPPSMGKLQQIHKLTINDNRLVALPKELGNLGKLQYLGLNTNQLSTLPLEIGNLSQLQYLGLAKNQLVNLPSEIGKLSQLRDLVFHQNQLDTLAFDLSNFSQLIRLGLSDNQFTSIPVGLAHLSKLKLLELYDNPFSEDTLARIRQLVPHATVRGKSPEATKLELSERNKREVKRYGQLVTEAEMLIQAGGSVNSKELAEDYNSLAWYQLLSGAFSAADSSLRRGLELDPDNVFLQAYIPPILLFQGKLESARKQYQAMMHKPYGYPGGVPMAKTFLNNIQSFERAGIIPESLQEEVAAIKKMLLQED